jgi:hypothetical protein
MVWPASKFEVRGSKFEVEVRSRSSK